MALAALSAVGGIVVWSRGGQGPSDRPTADAAGLFLSHATPAAQGAAPETLIAAWASLPSKRRFSVTVPAVARGAEYWVDCDHGEISIDFGGGTAGSRCNGTTHGVIGNPNGPNKRVHIRVTVDTEQVSRWGVAIYQID